MNQSELCVGASALENQKQRLLLLLAECFAGIGYIEEQQLFIGDNEISLNPLFGLFNRILNTSEFTKLPSLFDSSENFPITDMYVELTVARSYGFADPLRLVRGKTLAEEQEARHQQRYVRHINIDQCIHNPKHHHIVILGDPGSGKTSLLKYLCLKIANGESKRWVLPLFISLRRYWLEKQKKPSLSLLHYIAITLSSIADNTNFPMQHSLYLGSTYTEGKREIDAIENVLSYLSSAEQKNVIFLLDGFDEIATSFNAVETVSEEIRLLGMGFSWVLTSRFTGFYGGINEDICYEVVSLDKRGIEALVTNWFRNTKQEQAEEKAQSVIKQVNNNTKLRDIARNPFLLTLLCYVQNYNQQLLLPVQRSDVYAELIKLIQQQLRTKQCDNTLFRKFELDYVCRFSHYLYTEVDNAPLQVFEYEHWDACAAPDIPPDLDKHFLASRLLSNWRQKGDFYFIHLTFQEYFIALYLSNQAALNIKEHIFIPQWRMVYRFLAGIYGKKRDKKDIATLIRGLLEPVDKQGLLYIEAANLLVEAGIEDSLPILGYDLRHKLWGIWCDGADYTSESAGEALAKLSFYYLIDKIEELLEEQPTSTFTKDSISLLGLVENSEADDFLLQLYQSNAQKQQLGAINAIASKNTREIRERVTSLFLEDNNKWFTSLCHIAKLSGHSDYLKVLNACLNALPEDLSKYNDLFDVITIVQDESFAEKLLYFIQSYPVDVLTDSLLESFVSLSTIMVKEWLDNVLLEVSSSTLFYKRVLYYAISYGLLNDSLMLDALEHHSDEPIKYNPLNAISKAATNNVFIANDLIAKVAELALSNRSCSIDALAALARIAGSSNKYDALILNYIGDISSYIHDYDVEVVEFAFEILSKQCKPNIFRITCDFIKSHSYFPSRLIALKSLKGYKYSYGDQVVALLHGLCADEMKSTTKGNKASYLAHEAVEMLAFFNIKEIFKYANVLDFNRALEKCCAIYGVLLFDDCYIDNDGLLNNFEKSSVPAEYELLNASVPAVDQLRQLRGVCNYLLAKKMVCKTANHANTQPPPLFNKPSGSSQSFSNGVNVNTGNKFLNGEAIGEHSAKKILARVKEIFPAAFVV